MLPNSPPHSGLETNNPSLHQTQGDSDADVPVRPDHLWELLGHDPSACPDGCLPNLAAIPSTTRSFGSESPNTVAFDDPSAEVGREGRPHGRRLPGDRPPTPATHQEAALLKACGRANRS